MPYGHGSVRAVCLIFRRPQGLCRSVQNHVRLVCRDFFVILIVDAFPKLRVAFKNRVELFIESVDFTVKPICVLVRQATVKLINLRFQRFNLGKVRKQSRFLLFAQKAQIFNKAFKRLSDTFA